MPFAVRVRRVGDQGEAEQSKQLAPPGPDRGRALEPEAEPTERQLAHAERGQEEGGVGRAAGGNLRRDQTCEANGHDQDEHPAVAKPTAGEIDRDRPDQVKLLFDTE